MRRMMVVAALAALAACSSPTTPERRAVPLSRPSLAVDLTPPPTPANVSIVLDSIVKKRAFLTATWTDNSTFTDEFNTCGWFGTDAVNWAGKGSGCSYAQQQPDAYDNPVGSTGVRHSSRFIAVEGGPYQFTMRTNRRIELEPGRFYNLGSERSAPVVICADTSC